jgi:DNA-binding IclR family transcriptional regulator
MIHEMASMATDSHTERRAGRVQSLDRGLQLLELLGQATEPMSLAQLTERVQVDRSTAHRLLATLVQRGYVSQEAQSRRYRLGLRLVVLSRKALGDLTLRSAARPPMKELVRESGETANLVVLVGEQAVCIDLEQSPSVLSVTNEVGAVFVLHATAAGKVLLAHRLEAERLARLAAAGLSTFTPRTVADLAVLETQLAAIRRQGYAVDDEESHVGVRCIAAPVRDHQAAVVAALSLSGPAARVTLERLPFFVALAQKAAHGTSAALGCPAGAVS